MKGLPLRGRAVALTALVLLGPLLLALWQLRFFWTLDEQYSYGWSVPALAAVLGYFRWRDRPSPSPVKDCGWIFAALAAVALALAPLRLIQEATPDWSVVNWLLALVSIGWALLILLVIGGRAWARWWACPLLFLLTAVPWPQRFELALTGGLMRGVAAWSVEILGCLGVPAWCAGNLIHLPGAVLGVDEACSGVRSLQALLMATLFLGELFRFSALRRIGLCLAGLGLALTGNLLRTLTLSLIAARSGLEAVSRWHDPAGLAVLLFALAGTWWLAAWRRPADWQPEAPPIERRPYRVLPIGAACALLLWLGLVEGGVEWWYRRHEDGDRQRWSWMVQWPEARRDYRVLEVPARARRLLLCDQARGASWEESDGHGWMLYWLRWEPGRTATQSARMHRPDTCLQAGGAILQRDLGVQMVRAGDLELPFHLYEFAEGGVPMHVFFCLDEQANCDRATTALLQDGTGLGRMQRALAGRRNLGQQSLEAALIGYPSPEAATRAFAERLPALLMSPPGGPSS